MRISALILMSPLPAAWIAVGSLLLLLVVVMTILFLLKSREVSTLKKQCDELRDTMRMMRYEEANLARMLHTASKPVEPIETPEEEDVEGNADGLEVLESQESLEEQQEKEQPQEQQEQQEQEVQEEHEIEEVEEEQEELPVVGDIEEPQTIALQKQPISERRSALPVDLFSAWFAENEEEQEQPLVASQIEAAEQPVDVVAIQEEPATEEAVPSGEVFPSEEAVALPAVENEQEMVEAPQETELNKDDERFCRKLERIVITRMRNPNLNIDIIAAQFGIGRTNFYRKVREVMGMSPNDYLRKCRMERAAELLRSTEDNVGEVCAQVGMPDAQYFSRVFKAYFGVSPSVYRETNNQ